MKFIRLLAFFALIIPAFAGTITVGFEDLPGSGSDRDFNDTVFRVSGVTFHSAGTWNRPDPAMFPSETPFPYAVADYFDSSVATGEILSVFLFGQTALTESAYIRVGAGPWLLIAGMTSASAAAGDVIDFKLVAGDQVFYPWANQDGLPHAVEVRDAEQGVASPEPGSALLLLIGASAMYAAKKRIGKCTTGSASVTEERNGL